MKKEGTTLRSYPTELKIEYEGNGLTFTWDGFYMLTDSIMLCFEI